MWFYHPQYLRELEILCRENDLLLIFDEIATGFGRTGEFFAATHAGVIPDIMMLGKALTGGYMTFAATVTTEKIAQTISQGEAGVFMHGPTFMGNPLACAAACASFDVLANSDWKAQIRWMETRMKEDLEELRNHPEVSDIRCIGGIGVVETRLPLDVGKVQAEFVRQGVWIRPFGRNFYIMPPYIIRAEELSCLTEVMKQTVWRGDFFVQ